jgi:UPF0042 nucleotide-binding protein
MNISGIENDYPSGLNSLVLVTGLSGAGKTSALKILEDIGFEAVDNLPLSLLSSLIRSEGVSQKLAVGIDIRTRGFGVTSLLEEVDALKNSGHVHCRILFLDCDDDILCRRYTETRRRHPLSQDRPLLDGIRHERDLLSPLRARADIVLDTTTMPPPDLKRILRGHFNLEKKTSPMIFVVSFSFRKGLPREADLVFDTRFLNNPFYDPALRHLTGRDDIIKKHIEADAGFSPFFSSLTQLLEPLLPRFAAEWKSYLTIAIGCTGGRHRSVTTAEKLAKWLIDKGEIVDLRHRELEEGNIP